MARSTFYYNLKHSSEKDKYKCVKERIKEIFDKHKGRYGYRRITLELKNEGETINHKTVKKLMDELGLKSIIRKVKYRSYKGTVGKIASNIIERNFKADSPYTKVATDVSQINIGEDKCYLSPLMDMFNGEIISYTISDRPNLKMVMDMLDKMFNRIKIPKNMIIHSDQGWHYQHKSFQTSLKEHDIIQSMSRKGNCLDNAMMENFFGIMKSELLYVNNFSSMNEFKEKLREYIEYYNNDRIKIRLKGMSPVKYRTHLNIK